ncbi:MAG: voltage-gated chloride channel family protein [Mangrovibacterium sp.]
MTRSKIRRLIHNFPSLFYLLKWFIICLPIGAIVGSASAVFLLSLEWAGEFRDGHLWMIALLPIGGLLVGGMYQLWGEGVVKGNNLLLEEFHSPKKIIPFKMAPLVLVGTVLTHLFGGSAGREGTAVQIGGAVADQFTKIFKLSKNDRKIIILVGVAAGFASVFGTPLAGAVFALEVMVLGRIRLDAIVPSFMGAMLANFFCNLYPIHHTHYQMSEAALLTSLTPLNLLWAAVAGICFGLTAKLFSQTVHFIGDWFKAKISMPMFRPVVGGVVLALAFFVVYQLTGETKYVGLGVPSIVQSFQQPMAGYDFILKLLFTTFTLGCGFKGGEVTPLFFIGATLGNVLCWFIPLDMSLLAGMGFVGVFAGATNTPLACTLMGIELFGIEGGCFIAMACGVAYLFSEHTGIYSAQLVNGRK